MRVLVVTAPLPWDLSNGASLVLHHHLRILAERHEISILGAGAPERERIVHGDGRLLPRGVTMRWFGTSLPPSADYALRRLRSIRSEEPTHVHWVERNALVRALETGLRRRPDILHLHGWGTAALYRYASGIPSLHVPIDAWSLGAGNRAMPRWRRALERSQHERVVSHERRHYSRCGAVVVVAEIDAAHLRRLVPDARVEVVPNGVNAGPEPETRSSEPVIGFHGAFENQANRDAALFLAREVFPLVRSSRPEARLILIGRDPPPEIRGLSGEGIEVTGSVPDVREALRGVAVYVAPMLSGTGLKNKVLEAMASGLPVVATARAVEGIGAGTGIRVAETREGLARHALDLLTSADDRRAEGAAARERVLSSFTWERSAGAIERLWNEIAR